MLPKDLILWKVWWPEVPEHSYPSWLILSLRIGTLGIRRYFCPPCYCKICNLPKVAKKLGPSQKLSTLFPQRDPQDCLHIMVQTSLDTSELGSSLRTTNSDDITVIIQLIRRHLCFCLLPGPAHVKRPLPPANDYGICLPKWVKNKKHFDMPLKIVRLPQKPIIVYIFAPNNYSLTANILFRCATIYI